MEVLNGLQLSCDFCPLVCVFQCTHMYISHVYSAYTSQNIISNPLHSLPKLHIHIYSIPSNPAGAFQMELPHFTGLESPSRNQMDRVHLRVDSPLR